MVLKTSDKAKKETRELLILKATKVNGERVKRGQIIPYPDRHGALLTGAARKAVVVSDESVAAFEAEEERRAQRRAALDAARGGGASTQAGSPKKPPKNT